MLSAIGADPEHDDQSTFPNIDDFFSVDLRLSYAFSIPKAAPAPAVVDAKDAKDGKNVAPVQAATGCDWKAKLLDGLTLAVGCNNVFNDAAALYLRRKQQYGPFALRRVRAVRLLRDLEEVLEQSPTVDYLSGRARWLGRFAVSNHRASTTSVDAVVEKGRNGRKNVRSKLLCPGGICRTIFV